LMEAVGQSKAVVDRVDKIKATVIMSASKIGPKLTWLDEEEVKLQIVERSTTIITIERVIHDTTSSGKEHLCNEAEIMAASDALEIVGSWLLEAAQWTQKVHHMMDLIRSIKHATSLHEDDSSLVSEDDIATALQDYEDASHWLDEAEGWGKILFDRQDSIVIVHGALAEGKIHAEDVKKGLTEITSKSMDIWSSNCQGSDGWKKRIEDREEVIVACEKALAMKEVPAEAVQNARARLRATHATRWLVEAESWEAQVDHRLEVIKLVKQAMSGNVPAAMVEKADKALREAHEWLDAQV